MLIKELIEGDVIYGKFEQKLRSKRGMYHHPDIEIPQGYVRFEAEKVISRSGNEIGRIYGITKDGTRKVISTTSKFELADALASAYNAGGYTKHEIEKVELKDYFK